MSYATLTEAYRYLDQLSGEDPDRDVLLQSILDRATSMIDTYLGYSYAGYTAATTKVVYGQGTPFLSLPPHEVGSVTAIVPEGGTAVDAATYTQQEDGTIYLNSAYVPYPAPYASQGRYTGWGFYRYTVTADWGYGTVPASIKEACLELAMNIWKQKDRGFWTDFVGVTGASGQRFSGGLPKSLRDVLEIEKAKWSGGIAIA